MDNATQKNSVPLPASMRAVVAFEGKALLIERPVPQPKPGEALIKVHYAALNRADLYQCDGLYAPPKDASDILGLEVYGTIAALGEASGDWQIGDPVCALLSGGGYADYALAKLGHIVKKPAGLSMMEAAALPEAVTTVWMALFVEAAIRPGERLLIHGGTSGIGTTAIQMLHLFGCEVFVTAGTDTKCDACRKLGATAINYHSDNFTEIIRAAGGVDVVLDIVGGAYLEQNMRCLRPNGRLIQLAVIDNSPAILPLGSLLLKQLSVKGVTLRSRDDVQKSSYIRDAFTWLAPFLADKRFSPVIERAYSLAELEIAHTIMRKHLHIGKILLEIAP